MLRSFDNRALLVVVAFVALSVMAPQASFVQTSLRCWTFMETGKQICNAVLEYWNAHGGLARFGYPLSDELDATAGSRPALQYFERAVFMPRTSSSQREAIVPLQLGAQRFEDKYPIISSDKPLPTVSYEDMPGERLDFWEPWYPLSGAFLRYWREHGGASEFGYPISPLLREESELDDNTYTMQYFNDVVFEYHSENLPPNDVLLSQLGSIQYKKAYPREQDILHGDWCGSSVQLRADGTISFGGGYDGAFLEPVVLVFGRFAVRGEYAFPLPPSGRAYPGIVQNVHYIGRLIDDTLRFDITFDYEPERREGPYTVTKGKCP